MRRALISDIHGNLEALEVVLEDIKAQGIFQVITPQVDRRRRSDRCQNDSRDNRTPQSETLHLNLLERA